MFTLQFGTYVFPNQTFEVSGFDYDISLDSANIPKRSGQRIAAAHVEGRKIKITGTLHHDTEAQTYYHLNSMLKMLNNGEQDLMYRENVMMPCWLQKFGHSIVKGAYPCVANVKIDMASQVPFPRGVINYGSTLTLSTRLTTSFTIIYNGSSEAFPKYSLEVQGLTQVENIKITNTTTNESTQYNAGASGMTLAPNTSVTFDSDLITTKFNNSADYSRYFEGSFIRMIPGTNVFSISAATLNFTINWYERYYA